MSGKLQKMEHEYLGKGELFGCTYFFRKIYYYKHLGYTFLIPISSLLYGNVHSLLDADIFWYYSQRFYTHLQYIHDHL